MYPTTTCQTCGNEFALMPANTHVCLYPTEPKFNHIRSTCTGCELDMVLYTDYQGINYLQGFGRYTMRVRWQVDAQIKAVKLELDHGSLLSDFHSWVEGILPSDFIPT